MRGAQLRWLFETEAPRLRRFLLRFSPHDADDLAQESFVRLCAAGACMSKLAAKRPMPTQKASGRRPCHG